MFQKQTTLSHFCWTPTGDDNDNDKDKKRFQKQTTFYSFATQVAALQDENGALRTKIEALEEESVKKVTFYTKNRKSTKKHFLQETRSLELGKRLNILREQFGREQAASLEETYKQSREGGEEEETGRRAEYKSGGETGGRRRAEDQSRDYKA